MLPWFRDNRGVSLLVVAVVAAAFGLVSGWLTPRGPITAAEALVTMAAGAALGVAAGLATGSRWSLLVAPVAFIAAVELARLGVDGPTVDGIRLGSFYGIIALVLGRGLHFLLAILPMIVGTIVGIGIVPRQALGNRAVGRGAWATAGLLGVAGLALAVLIAIPARTPTVLGPDGEPVPDGVAELVEVEIGGHQQAMMIRGHDVDSPVLLYLAGGPGGTDIGALRRDDELEQDFVVAAWEQRGAGKSYSALDPAETLTVEQLVSDTIEVTNYLRQRFSEERIFIVGNSWGTTLAVLAAQERPDLFHAYVGAGQMVSQRVTDQMFYEDALAWAEANGNQGLLETLEENGPPPYDEVWQYEPVVNSEHDWNDYDEFDPDQEMPAILLVPEYSLMDKLNAFPAFLDSAAVLYPQVQDIDFREDVTSLDVPVYVVLGEHEARGRAVLAREWFELLSAPEKELIVFDSSGHRPPFEQPADFAALMRRVLTETYRGQTQ